jgi:thiol-disulfide isomerase/thioredoxin
MKKTLLLGMVLLFVTAGFAQQNGVTAPEIQLTNLKGTSVKLSSLKGKVVLIDFWASWCGPCRETIPSLKKLYSKYKSKGFEIYGISLDDKQQNWKRAVDYYKMDWTQVNDADGAVATKWKVNYIPSTFLLNKDGKIVAVNADEKELASLVAKMID